MKTAVLCYHSWNMNVESLDEHLAQLLNDGWKPLSLTDLLDIRQGSVLGEKKAFHVTNDDVSEADKTFADILRKFNCPATFFVQTGLIPQSRLESYQKLDREGLI